MGRTVLHRLNRMELYNVLTDVLGPEAAMALPDLPDPRVQFLDTNADALTVSPSTVDSMFETAKTIAEKLPAAALGTCTRAADERGCEGERIGRLALRLLRRPPAADETASYLALWDDVKRREGTAAATRAVLQRLLLAPEFLYHVEVGDPATGQLDDYELASRLAFLAWESGPDQALLDAAAARSLGTKAGARAQLERLLADPKGARTLRRFFALWSDLDKLGTLTKDPGAYPDFDVLRAPMREEFERFVGDLLQQNGTLSQLLTSRDTFVNGPLAALYGVPAPPTGFARSTLPPERAGGILTQGAFLAIHGKAQRSAPILRGIFVRERLLCSDVPPPPPGVSATVPPGVVTNRTTREYFASLTAGEACQGCHGLINPLGYTFEGFDGVGRARSAENGLPVDTSAEIVGSVAADGRFAGARELLARLAASDQVRDCLARFWFRSRFRRLETGGDERIVRRLSEALFREGGRLRALAAAIADEDALFYAHFRTPEGK
jgi:hypothetical protein